MTDEKWQGQKDATPVGYPKPGMWYSPEVKEGSKDGLNVADALEFFIQNGKHFNKQIVGVDAGGKTVTWSDRNTSSFDELVELYQKHLAGVEAHGGFMDGPVDLGKNPEGDFPSSSWMPSGQADQGVDTNHTSASINDFAKQVLHKQADSIQRGQAYILRSLDKMEIEIDKKVEAILKSNLTEEQKFRAIEERIREMFYELDDTSLPVQIKQDEWSAAEIDGGQIQGIIEDFAENELMNKEWEEQNARRQPPQQPPQNPQI